MRRLPPLILAACIAVSLSGCGESDATKANKKAINANSSDITLKLAHSSEDAGDFPAAERFYRQAITKDSTVAPRLELADFYRRHHGERQALAVLNDALRNEPKNTDVMRAIANTDIDMGNPAEAIKRIDAALAIKSDDAMLYNSKGVALDMLGKYTAARNSYSTALDLDPDNAMVFNANLAMSYIITEYYSKAINLLLPLADTPDSTPQIRQNLALAYGLKGDNINALRYAMKDMPRKQAEDNVKFYSMLAKKGGIRKPSDATPPSSVVNSIPPIP